MFASTVRLQFFYIKIVLTSKANIKQTYLSDKVLFFLKVSVNQMSIRKYQKQNILKYSETQTCFSKQSYNPPSNDSFVLYYFIHIQIFIT